jgi:serine/threonine protein kinase
LRYEATDEFCHADGAKVIESDDELLGETIGNYRIVRLLGEGGMGRVYLALHPRIGSRVAVKLLSPQASIDQELVQRFFAEAELVNKIRHEGIVNVLDLDHLPDGRPFITMEYLDGEPLSSTIARGPMALGLAANIGIEILEALHAAHASGVVHRDLKPDNIFISPKGRVKLLDFGIAKLMPEFQTTAIGPATQTGSLLGTPGYMAPEQVTGEPITGSTDLYAVGAVLYEALTGTMAFSGTTLFELLRRIVSDAPPPPVQRRPDLAGPFEALILRALSKRPEERFASAEDMSLQLASIRKQLGPEAWSPLPNAETRATARQPLAIGSEATMLPGDRELALGSEATMLPGNQRQVLGTEATMASGHMAPGAAISGAPGTGATLGLDSSHGSKNTSYPAQTHATRSKKPWILGLMALAAIAVVGVGVAVLQSSSSSATSSLETSPSATQAAAALEGTSDASPGAFETPDGGDVVVATTETPEANRDAKAVVPEARRPGGPPLGPRNRSPNSATPTAPNTSPPPRDKAQAATPPDAGATNTSNSSVTMIETGELHGKSTIRKAPDYNPKAFDAVAYLPKARKLAKQIYSDAILVEFDVEGVGANGKSNLALANFEATYNFLSRSHAKRTMPIGVDEDRPCWVYVEVDKNGVTARIVERDECKGKARPNPRCSMRDVWKRSDSLGTPAAKGKAVAHISYLWDGWFFDIDPLGVTGSIGDDC